MPRRKFTPTPTQRRALEAVRRAARERDRRRAKADEQLDRAIAAAADMDVPVTTIADALGWGRNTVYQHLNRDGS